MNSVAHRKDGTCAPDIGCWTGKFLIVCFLLATVSACALNTSARQGYLPRLAAAPDRLAEVPAAELDRLQLVATNLVSALVQLPERNPLDTTVQVSTATTAFGNIVIRALEDAGYGVQHVSADQGQHYVSYSRRYAETDAGPVTDYEIAVGEVRLRREFILRQGVIVPSSLLLINGSENVEHVQLNDAPFSEQGGVDTEFVSGVKATSSMAAPTDVEAVRIRADGHTPPQRRLSHREVLAEAKEQQLANALSTVAPALGAHQRLRRAVLIFDQVDSTMMGAGNKQAIRLMVRDLLGEDVFKITACTDVDGQNRQSRTLGTRVIEEFMGHGVHIDQLYLAPCRRASFRHSSDDSPLPVEVVQYRKL